MTCGLRFSLTFHIIAFLCDFLAWVVCLGLWAKFSDAYKYPLGGWTVFFTLWNQLTQAIYMGGAISADVFSMLQLRGGDYTKHLRRAHTFTDYLFYTNFATCNIVGLVYWFLIFPMLLTGKGSGIGDTVGIILTIFQHAFTWTFAWIEMVTVYRYYAGHLKALGMMLLFEVAYLAWSLICYAHNKYWPYAFLNNLSVIGLAGVSIGTVVVSALFTLLGRLISRKRFPNGTDDREATYYKEDALAIVPVAISPTYGTNLQYSQR